MEADRDGSRKGHFTGHGKTADRGREPCNSLNGSLHNIFMYNLPYSGEDEKTGMLCTTVGSVSTPPGTPYPQNMDLHPAVFRPVKEGRILQEFQLVYVASGEGVFRSGTDSCKVKPGSVMLVLPGIKHTYFPSQESGWHEYWVGFKGMYFSKLAQENVLSPRHIFFDTGVSGHVLHIFHQILDEVKNQRPYYQMKASACILSLISEVLAREKSRHHASRNEIIVEKSKNLMEENACRSSFSLRDIYDEFGISASKLNEIFTAHTSMTPYRYYINAKIRMAKSLLEKQDATVKEIAWSLGFEDQYYFSRIFKCKTGFSPSQWRENEVPLL
jgi:AraC-like DNA-binding protein